MRACRRKPRGLAPSPGRRASAIAVALFLALFALDALEGEASLGGKFVALAIHLVPTWLCLGGMLVAWRRSWLGGAIFAALALAYAWVARAHPDWILVISGPLLLVAALYALIWRRRSLTDEELDRFLAAGGEDDREMASSNWEREARMSE